MRSGKARGPGQSLLLLLDVAAKLTEQAIDYAVIGALAAARYGAIRATTDADALVAAPAASLASLAKSFRSAGCETTLRRGDADDPIQALLTISDRFGNRVDLLAGLKGLDPEAFRRTDAVPFRHATLRFVGREDFIAMKCFAGGPLDLEDARLALAVQDQPLDIELLRRIARRFGRNAADNLEAIWPN